MRSPWKQEEVYLKILKLFIVTTLLITVLTACEPAADPELPTIAVLATLTPSDIPPTDAPTAEPATPTSPPTAEPPTAEVVAALEAAPAQGCAEAAAWDASVIQLRETIYVEAAAAPAEQVQQLRDAVAALTYDDCVATLREFYLAALDEALLALAAPSRETAQQHEQNAAAALVNYRQELSGLVG